MTARKTRDLYVVQGNYGYGHGWEDLTAAETRKEARSLLKDYRENEPSTPTRLVHKMVRIQLRLPGVRDPAPKKERYRMPFKHKTSFTRLGGEIIGHFKGSEGHLVSAEAWREQAERLKLTDPKRAKEFLSHAKAHEKRAASKGMQTSHRRVLEGELWKVWPKEFKFISADTHSRAIRMKTREGYEDRDLKQLTDDEIMHLLHPARRDVKKRAARAAKNRGSSRQRRDALKPCPVGTQVQTLLLDKSYFDARDARGWAKRHGFLASKIDITERHYRFRQAEPSAFEPQGFRTMKLRPGVQAVVGCPASARDKSSRVTPETKIVRTGPREWMAGRRKFKTLRGAEGYWRRQTIAERGRREREGR